MGILAQPALTRRDSRSGFALPVALFGVVAVGLLSSGIWVLTEQSVRVSYNREEAARAMMLAEAGASHALAVLQGDLQGVGYDNLLKGSDNADSTSDDGLIVGYGLAANLEIPSGGVSYGGGTYSVQIIDDPASTEDGDPLNDTNSLVVVRCTGVSRTGAVATIDAIVGGNAVNIPAIGSNGDLDISGNPDIGTGACGSVHANGDLDISGNPDISGTATASGSAEGPGTQGGQPQAPIPDYSYTDFCTTSADYVLQSDGYVLRVSDMTLHNATSNEKFGWKRAGSSPVLWDQDDDPADGVYCIDGNAKVGGNPSGMSVSLIATGSLEISGNPEFDAPAHPDALLFYAGGDLKVNGNASSNYQGLMYARSQCETSGNPVLSGSLICYDESDPPGAIDLISENKINGNPTILYNCAGMASSGGARRYTSWYPVIGS